MDQIPKKLQKHTLSICRNFNFTITPLIYIYKSGELYQYVLSHMKFIVLDRNIAPDSSTGMLTGYSLLNPINPMI